MTRDVRRLVVMLPPLAVLLAWCCGPALARVSERWATDPQCAQGYFVVAFAAFALWARRKRFPDQPLQGNWWGIPTVAAALAIRLTGGRYSVDVIELASLIPLLVGCCLVLGGWPLLRWAWPTVLIIMFLLPLPWRIEDRLTNPLRSVATSASAYVMQTVGLPAVAESNIILVDEVGVGVVRTCSGLGMVITLFALTTTAVLTFRRELWQQVVILLSALPIALLANLIRLTLTGVLHEFCGKGAAEIFSHDLGGWVMMPLALAILWLVYFVLDNFFYEVDGSARSLHVIGLSAIVRARMR